MASFECNSNSSVTYTADDHVAYITLNRPDKRNAFNAEMIAMMNDYLRHVKSDPNIQCLVLKANGEHFSAGADLQWMMSMAEYDYAENLADATKLADLMYGLANLSIPLLALVQGAVYGGGVGLVACADMVLASETSRFCMSEVKLGLIPAVISPYVVQAIGQRAAKYYMLSANVMDARQALALGLVHQLCASDGKLQVEGQQLLSSIRQNSSQAMLQIKELVADVAGRTINEDIIDETANAIAKARMQADAKMRIDAFLKRK